MSTIEPETPSPTVTPPATRVHINSASATEIANGIRMSLRQHICCPAHAMEVALVLLAGLALDIGKQPSKAARLIERHASAIARSVKHEKITMAKTQ